MTTHTALCAFSVQCSSQQDPSGGNSSAHCCPLQASTWKYINFTYYTFNWKESLLHLCRSIGGSKWNMHTNKISSSCLVFSNASKFPSNLDLRKSILTKDWTQRFVSIDLQSPLTFLQYPPLTFCRHQLTQCDMQISQCNTMMRFPVV